MSTEDELIKRATELMESLDSAVADGHLGIDALKRFIEELEDMNGRYAS